MNATSRTAAVLRKHLDTILQGWIEGQRVDRRVRADRLPADLLAGQSRTVLDALAGPLASGNLEDVDAPEYTAVRRVLADLAAERERMGFTPLESAAGIIMLKDYCMPHIQAEFREEPEVLNDQLVVLSKLVDSLAMLTFQSMVQRRESMIAQQAREILEISTPVVQLWDGVVAAPLIGSLDSRRTQQFMERLLERVVETNSPVALVDITGVPSVDTQTAQHLIETVSAVRLLGAQVVLTGVRPQIAQTLVHLGIDLSDVLTRSSLAAGFRVALDVLNLRVAAKQNGAAAG